MNFNHAPAQVVTRKAARDLIENAILNVPELQAALRNKKFRRRLKKAGKYLTSSLPKSVPEMKEASQKKLQLSSKKQKKTVEEKTS